MPLRGNQDVLPGFFFTHDLPLFYRADGACRHAVSAVQAVLLSDHMRDITRINTLLRAYRRTAAAADAGVCNEIAFFFLLASAEDE